MQKYNSWNMIEKQPDYMNARNVIEMFFDVHFFSKGLFPKFYIRTYGCQMNSHDSEKIKWMLSELGCIETEKVSEADLIIYNTCLIRENAENKVLGNIGSLKSLKQKKPDLIIALCGCMMQKEEIVDVIRQKYQHVDIVFGTNNIHAIPFLLAKNIQSGTFVSEISKNIEWIVEDIQSIRMHSFKSYVNIMYGCDNFCTFCVVPYARGREISRMPKDILKEISMLSQTGCKEVMLLGQNVNSYGKKSDFEYRFPQLLKDVNQIEGIERIRFMTSHPRDISDELIDCYGTLEHLCDHIHLPVQSGSDRILKLMNRHYDTKSYLEKIDKLRKRLPHISISTDIIVGFPNETEEDFGKTLSFVQEVGFDSAYTFIYSKRPGTKAWNMPNHIEEEIKQERLERLNEVMDQLSLSHNRNLIGTVQSVLVEEFSKKNDNILMGRTSTNKIIHFSGDETLIGKFVDVKIESAKTYTLEGTLRGES